MPSVLVTTSPSHPVRTDIVVDTLPDDWRMNVCDMADEGIERGSSERMVAAARGHDAVLLRPGRATRELFETADSLRVLAVHGSGYSRVDLDAATDNYVAVTHSPGAPAPAVVEYTVCAMIALLRDLTGVHERTTAGSWDTAGNAGRKLGRTPRTGQRRVTVEAVGEPVTVDGVKITPDDVVVADATGVVVVPADEAQAVAETAEEILSEELLLEEKIASGATVADLQRDGHSF